MQRAFLYVGRCTAASFAFLPVGERFSFQIPKASSALKCAFATKNFAFGIAKGITLV
jgi:hypothetical protein